MLVHIDTRAALRAAAGEEAEVFGVTRRHLAYAAEAWERMTFGGINGRVVVNLPYVEFTSDYYRVIFGSVEGLGATERIAA